MNKVVNTKLCELIATYGQSITDDPEKCDKLLNNMCREHFDEVVLLIKALKQDIVRDILTISEPNVDIAIFQKLERKLCENLSIRESDARLAIESWAIALGKIKLSTSSSPIQSKQVNVNSKFNSGLSLEYVQKIIDLNSKRLYEIIDASKNDDIDDEISSLKIYLSDVILRGKRPFKLGVMGEFRSGKSTLINALIGKEVALTDIMETTATLNLYQYGENPEGQIIYTDKHIEQFPPEQLNAILDERRNDEAWLKSIEYVSFNTKSDFLKHISIWDTPGLTGSLFNEKMAKSFIEEVDAALWIFDVNYPGQERIQEFLDELGRRGKKVVGIINKADGFTIEGIRKVQDYLAKVYDGVSFCHWLNVSALRAFEYITGSIFSFPCVTSEAIPDDGGLQELKRYLLEDLLAQPKLLILQASAGDISAVAVSLQEKHSQATSELRRKIWLFKKQIDLLRVKSEETVNMICKEVCDGLRQWLPRSICDDLENELNKAEYKNLKNPEWVKKNFKKITDDKAMAQKISDFIKPYETRIVNAWVKTAQLLKLEYKGSLTASELSQILELPDFSRDLVVAQDSYELNINTRTGDSSFSISSNLWQGGGAFFLGAYLLLAPVPAIIHVIGLLPLAIGVSHFTNIYKNLFRKDEPEPTKEELQDEIINQTAKQLIQWSNNFVVELQKRCIYPYLLDINTRFIGHVTKILQEVILNNREVSQIENSAEFHITLADKAKQCAFELQNICEIKDKHSSRLLNIKTVIGKNERGQIERALARIWAGSYEQVCVTDKSFCAENFMLFRTVKDGIPIQLLTYDEPSRAGANEDFRKALIELRQRKGTVRVRMPVRVNDKACAIGDNQGCWIFTEKGGYHLSHSLSMIGYEDIEITPYDDDGQLKEKYFLNWWDERIEGVHSIDL